ncbi:MAG: GNAT family N-acetyltransferase [Terriglobales bacterium]
MGTTDPRPVVRSYPFQYVSPWAMPDGTEVTIRPIRPEDEPLMVRFHETLSDRTVYLRYFSSLSLSRRTDHERLARICFGDYEHEIALVVEHEDPRAGDLSILGVGRLNKLPADREAEVVVLISDQYQHRGLGTELVRRLIKIAQDQNLHRLVAEMLRDNLAIQTIFKRLGFRLRLGGDPTSVQAVLDL